MLFKVAWPLPDCSPLVLQVCFSAALILSLLRGSLPGGSSDSTQLILTNTVKTPKGQSIEVSWALGALITELLDTGGKLLPNNHAQQASALANMSAQVGVISAGVTAGSSHGIALLAALCCMGLLMLMYWFSYMKVGVIARHGRYRDRDSICGVVDVQSAAEVHGLLRTGGAVHDDAQVITSTARSR